LPNKNNNNIKEIRNKMTQEFRIVKVKGSDNYAIVDQDNDIVANPIDDLAKAKIVLKGLNSGESIPSLNKMRDTLPATKIDDEDMENVKESSEKMYRTHSEDGEWFVVDQEGNIIETATDRRNAIQIAADLNKGDDEDKPKGIHQGSSYGNTPDVEMDESDEEKSGSKEREEFLAKINLTKMDIPALKMMLNFVTNKEAKDRINQELVIRNNSSMNEAFNKLSDKQLQDKFVDLKIKAKDLSKDSKESKELQKIRDEIAKRKAAKKDLKESEEVDEGIKLFNSSTDLTKLTDKQLQDMFIHVKIKSNDAALLQKIRDERAKRKESGSSMNEAFDNLSDKQLQDKFVDLKIKAKDLSKDSKESKQLQKIRDEIAKRKSAPKKDVKESLDIKDAIFSVLNG
jgi:hypothetical protein